MTERKEVNKMPEKEDKQKILDYLCEALQHTKLASNIDNIKYLDDHYAEYALIQFDDYSRKLWVDITADDGSMVLVDVLDTIRRWWKDGSFYG